MDYSRKPNTDNYQSRIARRTNKGEEMLGRVTSTIVSFDDLLDRSHAVEQWITDTKIELTSIYKDETVRGAFQPPIADLILEKLSHDQVVSVLAEIVSERLAALAGIVEQTRAQYGKV